MIQVSSPVSGKTFFSSPERPERLWGPPIQWELGVFPGDKATRRDVDQAHRSNAGLRKSGTASLFHQYPFMAQTEIILPFL
jgi:hypothetical protein